MLTTLQGAFMNMLKKITLMTALFIGFFMTGSIWAKADTATANNMIPMLRAMYQVDYAEAILQNNLNTLNTCRANKASDIEIAIAQGAVTDATNLLGTLNGMIARDVKLISAAPAGVVNTPTLAVNNMTAQGAWSDYFTKAKVNHLMIFPTLHGKKNYSKTYTPFCMY